MSTYEIIGRIAVGVAGWVLLVVLVSIIGAMFFFRPTDPSRDWSRGYFFGVGVNLLILVGVLVAVMAGGAPS